MAKRFFVRYTSDRKVCGEYDHPAGNASTLKSAKAIISSIRRDYAEYNPRNFRVYDTWADVEESTNHVPCVYSVDQSK